MTKETKKKKHFQIGNMVTVYNRYLFAVPVRGIIKDISSHDGALSIMFNHDEKKNVRKYDNKYFFPEECRIYVVKKRSTTKEGGGMTIDDFEKLKTGDKLNKELPDGNTVRRIFAGIVAGKVITCLEDASCPRLWSPRELRIFSIYEPPKEKVKLYLYAKGKDENGCCSSRFYSDDFNFKWDGLRMVSTSGTPSKVFWKKTNTFIEVEV